MDKPTKPTDLMPRSFGGVKNNWSASMQSSGYEDGVPTIYGGDNVNYQLDTTGKELDYCEKIVDFINAMPINKSLITDQNNKLIYTQYGIRVYNANETFGLNDVVMSIIDNEVKLFKSLVTNNIGNSLANDTYWEEVQLGGGSSRNIGEIVQSTVPQTDAGLHLLDGALIQGSGSYSAFVDYIAGLVTDYPNLFCTEADWQTAVTTYGVCGKFVYDSVNNTVRLPRITGIIEGTTDLTALGDLVQAGLPNIIATFGALSAPVDSPSYSGAIDSATTTGTGVSHNNAGHHRAVIYDFNASASNPTYGNSSTVQPQTIKVLYYIVIATSTKTSIQVDIDEIATDLNGKADVDLTNCTTLATVHCVVETYINGTSWYRVWSDGWCEQGGRQSMSANSSVYIDLLKPYANTNYAVSSDCVTNGAVNNYAGIHYLVPYSTTQVRLINAQDEAVAYSWQACGYIA